VKRSKILEVGASPIWFAGPAIAAPDNSDSTCNAATEGVPDDV
jgi:hypothetical protein